MNEQADRWLRDALHGVAAPAGLRERIRRRLHEEADAHTPIDLELEADNGGLTGFDFPESDSQGPVELARPSTRGDAWGRRAWLAAALALSCAALIFGVFQWSRPYSLPQLAQRSLKQLDVVLGEEFVWRDEFREHFAELEVLNGRLVGSVHPLGYQDQPGEPLAERCRVWKLFSNKTHKSFYVLDFQEARQVRKLSSQLQVLNRVSGGWSMAAMRTDDRVIVVLFEGALEDYLHRLQSA